MTRRAAEPRDAAIAVVRALRDAGHEALFAGGCVRDELLGGHPEDYDVATDATPDRVGALFPGAREVGRAFGVMLVRRAGVTVEVATFRAEHGYSDRRRPDRVTFVGAEEDARRRDFTINAVFVDPLDTAERPLGRVIDHVGGVADLDAGLVRAVGDPDERLAEDDLRALRAVRFAARLGFRIDGPTADAIRRHARELSGVSRERVGDELRRMLARPGRAGAADLMQRLGLDAPALADDPRPDAPLHALAGLPDDAPFTLALGAWTADRLRPGADAPPPTPGELRAAASGRVARLRDTLCLTNDERSDLRATLALGADLADPETGWPRWGVARRKRAAASPPFDGAFALTRAHRPDDAAAIDADVAALASDGVGLAPSPLIGGDDLIGAGLEPGPKFGLWLDLAYDEQLEGRLASRDEGLRRVLAWASGAEQPPGSGG